MAASLGERGYAAQCLPVARPCAGVQPPAPETQRRLDIPVQGRDDGCYAPLTVTAVPEAETISIEPFWPITS